MAPTPEPTIPRTAPPVNGALHEVPLELVRTNPARPQIEIVVPVYNEERVLVTSIGRLHRYLEEHFPLTWRVTIVDNASTDATWSLARALSRTLSGVQVIRLDEKGRGRALRAAWSRSAADVVAYVDADLSTDLDALYPLVAPLVSGHSGVAIGSRLAEGSHVRRGLKREVISRTYNLILRGVLGARFSDAQCGFKALRRDVALDLLPLVEDESWFFDTELLILAERNGIRIHEVPVDWVDDPDSSVEIAQTALNDLRGVVRLLRNFARGGGWIDGPGSRVPHGSSRHGSSRHGSHGLVRHGMVSASACVAIRATRASGKGCPHDGHICAADGSDHRNRIVEPGRRQRVPDPASQSG